MNTQLTTLFLSESLHYVQRIFAREHSVLSFVRQSPNRKSLLLIVLNLTPVFRHHYRFGLPESGFWREVLNSDSKIYGGANHGNFGGVHAEK